MAGLVVENTKRILYENISLLQEKYYEKAAPGGAKWMGRLQAAAGPHKSGNDPHIAGCALDIMLFASIPRDLNVADQLVEVFLNLRESMGWITVIYNNWQWNRAGRKFPRTGSASNRHITHIHIEWGKANLNHMGFESQLSEAAFSITDWGKPGSIEGLEFVQSATN